MLIKRIVQLLTISLLCMPFIGKAQVTTSSITGTVKTAKGELLEGATIVATHLPSGTVYTTTAKKGGNVNLPAMRIGGPYQIKVSYVGFKPETIDDVYLALGEPYNFTTSLKDDASTIEAVTVVATRRRVLSDKTGMSTVIGQRQITTAPTISRSITDLTRLTPQSNGTNFAGRDSRYNNMVVDGANLNNNFGLSTDLLPGGGNPISLDAFDEISVNIAPFDVRQAAFTGAGINAVTKSGTNTFRGSAYGYYRDESLNGTKVKGIDLGTLTPNKNKIYGATLGGPIIKNKLFFFVSAEWEESERPPTNVFKPTGGSGSGAQSAVSIDSLRKLSDYLSKTYAYDPGGYDGVPNLTTKNRKLLGKIDWNISKNHKLTLKYSDYDNNNDVQLNASSLSFAAGQTFTVKSGAGTGTISNALPNNRISANSLSFGNSNYGFHDVVRSGAFELNSNFNGKFANQFLATYTKIQDTRTVPGKVFPFIDILNNDARNYMSVGTDPFSNNNDVVNDVINVTDNFSYFAGKHTITAGVSYEYQKVGNMFMGASQSYYLYNSLNDFVTNQAPAGFSLTYSLIPGQPKVYSAELKIGQLGFYAQDEINVNENLKITAGLRVDQPIYLQKPLENVNITSLTLPNQDGDPTHYNTGQWPKSTLYWSPRIGFRWNAESDRSLVIRGGTGIFTGRLPFVWLTNMPSNSGMYQASASVTNAAQLQNYKFNPDPLAYEGNFSHTPTLPASFVLIDRDFKYPQVWRTNLAFDKRFGTGWSATGEILFTKDLNGVFMRNANEKPTDGTFTGSPDNRPRFSANNNNVRRIYPSVGQAIVLENTSKGYSGTFTVGLTRSATKGFYGSLFYNYTIASDVTGNPGSTASSVWSGNFNKGTQNSEELYSSQYVIPHRILANLSYRIEYLKHLATTIGIYYEGASQGSYSYIYGNDVNYDGNTADLLYIPKNPSEISFAARPAAGTTTARTAQEQSDAFFALIENDPYLSKHKGQYSERNSAYLPFYHRVDAKILQDIFTNVSGHRNTLQISLDIINVANLLNKNWGIRQQVNYRNPLTLASVDANGKPSYWMTQVGGQLPTTVYGDIVSSNTTWGLQIGVRYIF